MRTGICQTSPPTFFTWPSVYLSRDSFAGSLPALVLVKLPSSEAPLSILESAASSLAWRSDEFAGSADFCSATNGGDEQATLTLKIRSQHATRRIIGYRMAR